jgi:hypothetical protein
MNTQRQHLGALEFINDILLARARLAQAKSDLAVANARVQAARRPSERNRPAVRFARKQVRHADTEFIRARNTLAKMEKKYFTRVQQTGPLHQQLTVKRPASVVRFTKEKKPAIIFRGYPLVSANAPSQKKQNPVSPPKQH